MKTSRSLAKLITGFTLLGVSLVVFIGSRFGDSLLPAVVSSGKLGASTSEILSRVMEVVIAVLTSLVGTGIFSKTPWMQMLIDTIGPLFIKTESISDEEKFQNDLMRLLAHSISQKDKDMTIMLCEQLAGEPYLTEPVTEQPQTFPSAK